MYLGSCQTFIIELLSGLFIQCLRKIFPKPCYTPDAHGYVYVSRSKKC